MKNKAGILTAKTLDKAIRALRKQVNESKVFPDYLIIPKEDGEN